jgi:hypothetical protein
MILWLRRKHRRLTWKQVRRRYYGADRISVDGLTLFNPARMTVERYRYRGAQSARRSTSTWWTRRERASATPPTTTWRSSGRSLNSSPEPRSRGEPDARERARPVRRAAAGRPTAEKLHGVPPPTQQIPFEAEAANLFFQLVSSRYERASLIVTSNKPFGRWGEVFGDDVVAAAMIDRLVHHAEVVALKGDSYRLKNRNLGRVPTAATDET